MIRLRFTDECGDFPPAHGGISTEEILTRLFETALVLAAPDIVRYCSDSSKNQLPGQDAGTDRFSGQDAETGRTVYAGIDLTIVSDEAIRGLNREHRGIDRATDVLSFPMLYMHEGRFTEEPAFFDLIEEEEGAVLFAGDIVISRETAERQAHAQSQTFISEILFLAVHGALHLFGYDHETKDEEEIMRALQRRILKTLSGDTKLSM